MLERRPLTDRTSRPASLLATIDGELLAKTYFAGRHSSAPPKETIARVDVYTPRIGITRVANLTGLDRLGIPVVSVCRPNARSLALSQGKGLDLESAIASGLMESAEIWHAENIEHALKFGDFASLVETERVIDIARLPQLKDSRYSDRLRMLWIEGENLVGGETLWVPYEAVRADFVVPRPPGSGCFDASTNGLASGLDPLEALIHGTCEVIERDAVSLMFHRAEAEWRDRRVRRETLETPSLRDLLVRVDAAGLHIAIWDITTDLEIPAFYVLLFDRQADASHLGIGSGCHLCPEVALLRAITEAAQVRTTYLSGARDDLREDDFDPGFLAQRARWARALGEKETGAVDFSLLPDLATASLNEDFLVLKRQLLEVGVKEIVAVDLSRQDFPIAVVKVIIPGLEGPHDYSGYRPGRRALELRR